ncbi:FAD-binding protein [Zavarzinia sp.]|uniref:FAD-binding protein n=1 Tax=Zavarzinia sp. TaxID=2027920 RepID=UPI003565039F
MDKAAEMAAEGLTCDTLVLGSGSAGLAAALAAAASGLDTIIAEKTEWIGGTTALSGAGTWIPANHHAARAGIADSRAEALDYILAAAPADWRADEERRWRRFAQAAPDMLAFVEANSPLRFDLVDQGDPLADLPGAKPFGRMLTPRPLRPAILGPLARRIRPPMLGRIFTYQEILGTDLYHRPFAVGARLLPHVAWRWLTGRRAKGTALVAGLLRGCLDHGARLLLETPALSLLRDEATGRVTGALLRHRGRDIAVHARRGVVIATGGFEWDAERRNRHFPGPMDFVTSPPGNNGDGHRMAEAAGATLARMDQANLNPAVPKIYEGQLQGMALFFHRAANAIVVDRNARRFFDESIFNFGEVIDARDPATGLPRHLPAWLIADAAFLRWSPLLRWHRRYRKDWLVEAGDLATLAGRIGLPPAALAETVARYNRFCAAGLDRDFGRKAVSGNGRHQSGLGPIARPPFVAIPFNRSFVSTKGGPLTDENGRVLRADGSIIAGLYCAGVAMANPFGTRGIGAGTTIGPNMTWGHVCGLDMAGLLPPLD